MKTTGANTKPMTINDWFAYINSEAKKSPKNNDRNNNIDNSGCGNLDIADGIVSNLKNI